MTTDQKAAKDQKVALETILYEQLEMVQRTIDRAMRERKRIGDDEYYRMIELWSSRETEIRHEISRL